MLPNSKDKLNIPSPSDPYKYNGYKTNLPEPPRDGHYSVSGLKSHIEYGKKMRNFRDISPRFLQFGQHLKVSCEKALKLPTKGKAREESLHSISIVDGMLCSHWYVSISHFET